MFFEKNLFINIGECKECPSFPVKREKKERPSIPNQEGGIKKWKRKKPKGKNQMENQKLENLLNLALNATPEELEKSENLSVGYESEQRKWEVIVKYSGEPEIFENPEVQTVRLLGGFAILTLSQNQIERLTNDARVEFIEKPKRLFFAVNE